MKLFDLIFLTKFSKWNFGFVTLSIFTFLRGQSCLTAQDCVTEYIFFFTQVWICHVLYCFQFSQNLSL
jgi:hypothetical protein